MRLAGPNPVLGVSEDPDCPEVVAALQAYLDGELAERDASRIAEHLAGCARCASEAVTVREVIDRIRRQRPALDLGALGRLTGVVERFGGPDGPVRPAP